MGAKLSLPIPPCVDVISTSRSIYVIQYPFIHDLTV